MNYEGCQIKYQDRDEDVVICVPAAACSTIEHAEQYISEVDHADILLSIWENPVDEL